MSRFRIPYDGRNNMTGNVTALNVGVDEFEPFRFGGADIIHCLAVINVAGPDFIDAQIRDNCGAYSQHSDQR